VEFRFGPKEHSLQVSAKSAEKSGHGEEWVNGSFFQKTCSFLLFINKVP
jgi:hypothetical protein